MSYLSGIFIETIDEMSRKIKKKIINDYTIVTRIYYFMGRGFEYH